GAALRTVTIGGERAPIIGRIAMQQCSIDVTHLQNVKLGDEVELHLRRTSAGSHLPRVYIEDSK
ncbi:MAG TPA: alanine racemase C-terminal domain-containing protein, partial [Abditibacteriaceae bacterium]